MTTYVEIAVHVPQVSGSFHYHLPEDWDAPVKAGQLVTVPFGQQIVQGIILSSVDHPETPRTKAVLELVDPIPVVTPAQIRLAHTLAEDSLSTLGACLSLMLPPGLSQMADTLYQLTASGAGDRFDVESLSAPQQRLLAYHPLLEPLRSPAPPFLSQDTAYP